MSLDFIFFFFLSLDFASLELFAKLIANVILNQDFWVLIKNSKVCVTSNSTLCRSNENFAIIILI